MAKNRFEKLCSGLENTAKTGRYEKEVTTFLSYLNKLRSDGFEIEILSRSQKHNGLVTFKVSWQNACKNVSPLTLEHYIYGNIDAMPSPAFRLCVLAHRANRVKT